MSNFDSVIKTIDNIEKFIGDVQIKQKEHSDEILMLKQRGVHMGGNEAITGNASGLGAEVSAKLRENSDLLAKTRSLRLETKAAGDVITTTMARTILTGGVGSPAGVSLGVQNAFRVTQAGGVSAHEYSRFLAVEGAAGVQAGEGVAKAAVRPTFELINQPALTVAGYSKLSKQALNDSNELRAAVDVTLVRSCATALDAALMAGNVTPAFSGLLTLATAYTSLVYTAMWDAASEAVATMQVAGFQPDTVLLSPADWLAVQTAINPTSDDYYSGSYLAPLAESLRGLRVVVSPSMTTGKVMVVDSAHIEMLAVDNFSVEVGYENDDFTKNIATLLGEMRVIPVYRATGAARLITPKAAA